MIKFLINSKKWFTLALTIGMVGILAQGIVKWTKGIPQSNLTYLLLVVMAILVMIGYTRDEFKGE